MAILLLLGVASHAADQPAVDKRRLAILSAGDSVTIQVYGQPELATTDYVGDDGTVSMPLVGHVPVAGLSPVEAAKRLEKALKDGEFLLDPHVTVTVSQSSGQRVAVLGQIKGPGRYPFDPSTTVFDLLALAGGVTENAGSVVYINRVDPSSGKTQRIPVPKDRLASQTVQSGDSIEVPKGDQFYIYGEVTGPNMYHLEPGMTVMQAIIRAGGITPRGSERRVDVKRMGKDGKYVVSHAKPGDLVQPDDVILVKESLFRRRSSS